MSKEKKQTPQQAFNQFIFSTMMDKLRAVELYEKEVAGYSKQLSQHVIDHRENAAKLQPWIDETNEGITAMLKALPEIEILKTQMAGMEEKIHTVEKCPHKCHNIVAIDGDHKRIIGLEEKITILDSWNDERMLRIANLEQSRGVAQECGNAQAREILKMQEQIKGLENRLSRAQDMIAECHPLGCIPPAKKPTGRPKKGA